MKISKEKKTKAGYLFLLGQGCWKMVEDAKNQLSDIFGETEMEHIWQGIMDGEDFEESLKNAGVELDSERNV